MKRFLSALGACLLVAWATPGLASTWTFTLQDVTFEDSQTASGYFNYDPVTGVFGSFLMTTSDGGLYDPSFMNPFYAPSSPPSTPAQVSFFGGFFPLIFGGINFNLGSDLTQAGLLLNPVVLVIGGNEFVAGEICAEGPEACHDRNIVSGSLFAAALVSETPLPAALPLFAGGLGAFGFLAHRRRKTAVKALRAA